MSKYYAEVVWQKAVEEKFVDNKYSRRHSWKFDENVVVPASSSPHIVPLPYSEAAAVDPEEALVAALSSCHMLFFLSFAAQKRFSITNYADRAVGVMGKDEHGVTRMLTVTLNPEIDFTDDGPTKDELAELHHRSHAECFLANSVKCDIIVAGFE